MVTFPASPACLRRNSIPRLFAEAKSSLRGGAASLAGWGCGGARAERGDKAARHLSPEVRRLERVRASPSAAPVEGRGERRGLLEVGPYPPGWCMAAVARLSRGGRSWQRLERGEAGR